MTVEEIYRDRETFSSKVQEVVGTELMEMGLEVKVFTIKDINDSNGYIQALGVKQIAEKKKDAEIAKAEASRETQIETSKARRAGEQARLQAETEIAEATKLKNVQEAAYMQEQQAAKAKADAAYEIQKNITNKEVVSAEMDAELLKQERQKDIEAAQVQIQITKEQKNIELAQKQAERKKESLRAEVVEPAIADKEKQQTIADAEKYREELLDAASMFDDSLMEEIMENGYEGVSEEKLIAAIRKGTISEQFVGVFCGSAHVNKGIQPLLDAVARYLPAPNEVENVALDLDNNEKEVKLESLDNKPCVALAFKLDDGQYGQLTYTRVYQGKIKKGEELFNTRTKKKFKVGRLVRMNSAQMEDISEGCAGDIVALFGVDCASGDTFVNGGVNYSMASMYVPEPVISLSIKPKDKNSEMQMSKALNRFVKEDPTFRVYTDPESGETIIKGMGELHLEVYVERMKREYNCEVVTGAPQVAYRESITTQGDFNYTHKKQSGGSGQYGRVAGFMEPCSEKDYEFVDAIKGGAIPNEFIPSCDKGFQRAMKEGSLIGAPIVGVKITINDGQSHPVDSNDNAFQTAAIGAFREGYMKAKPAILEPIMKVQLAAPTEFQGNLFGLINQRRGVIVDSTDENGTSTVNAEVPLSEMFGFSTILRSSTQGKGEFTMEFEKYGKVPNAVADELIAKYKAEREAAKK